MEKAKWRHGFGFVKADAQRVADEIMSIGDDVTPQQVLEKARNENTELHKCFEWDDAIASEKYRLIQARDVIRFLVIEEETVPTDRPEVRLMYKTDNATGYKSIKVIMQDKTEYEKLLERAWAELRAFKSKYAMLTELEEIFSLID
jgi:hypothetical protein